MSDELEKRTNEIKIAAPLLAPLDIDGIVITADALLTQRAFARHLVEERKAHYHFTVKGNQKTLLEDIRYYFAQNQNLPNAVQTDTGHGRIETRTIRVTNKLNDHLNFPHVAQVFMIERTVIQKKTGKTSREVVYGVTSQPDYAARPSELLKINRGHWCIENSCHYILDWVYDEDRCCIRKGYGPENISRLRRFAISVIKTVSSNGVAETMRDLTMNTRLVFDYLGMTENSFAGYSA